MEESLLLDYYFSLWEVLVILSLVAAGGGAVYWWLCWRWRNRLETLEQRHTHALAKHDSGHFHMLHNHLQSAIAHEFRKYLIPISKASEETLEGLGEGQTVLRDKQKRIISIASVLDQHADNVIELFDPEADNLETEFLNVRRLIEGILGTVHVVFGESEGVTLRPHLEDVEPTLLDRHKTIVALNNVIHNAIKYSHPGGVVDVDLSLHAGEQGAARMICIEVTDRGKGIKEEDQERVFELRTRGDGLIDTGSGLGLYLARRAARLQGGDVVLVRSSLNQGSVFRVTLPYRAADLEG
jgi:signal transduction histidine kinase